MAKQCHGHHFGVGQQQLSFTLLLHRFIKSLLAVVVSVISAMAAASPEVSSAAQKMVWLAEARGSDARIVDINEDTFTLISQQIPNLQIERVIISPVKRHSLLQQIPNSCSGNLLPLPERRGWGVFSTVPQVVFPGLRLHIHKDHPLNRELYKLNQQNQKISISELLVSKSQFRLGYAGGRSYGTKLDALLNIPAFQDKVWQRNANETASGLLQMFSRQRVDLLIEYPNVVSHYLQQDGKPFELQSYAIDESPAVLHGHLVCADTTQGRELVRQFDLALQQLSKQPNYLDAHLRWFLPDQYQQVTELYNRAYNTSFNTPAR